MATHNTSDMIEAYLKQLLAAAEAQEVEIQRAELADKFDVVPSQINYVIKTRFTTMRGFDVESKRGGGGYIRIVKFHYSVKHEMLQNLKLRISDSLLATELQEIVQLLFDEEIVTEGEANLLLSVLSSEKISDSQRSSLLIDTLQELDKENDI